MSHATFGAPDLTTFCNLDALGLEVAGQRVDVRRAVLECQVVDADDECRSCGGRGRPLGTASRTLAHEPFGGRPTTLLVRIRRYRCTACARFWLQDTSAGAEPRAKVSRGGLGWALRALVVDHLSVSRIAAGLGVAWNTANDAVLNADLVGGFLQHLETDRGNCAATRNARRAALRSFFTYASYRAPDSIATISQVLAIPAKRTKRTLVSFLTGPEAEALIGAPDTSTWIGRRDRLLLHLGIQTGLRVSELVGLSIDSIQIGPHSQLECVGKGRKQRVIPLQKNTARLLAAWLRELPVVTGTPLFPTHAGTAMTRAAVTKLVARHVQSAAQQCPSLSGKNVTPHTLPVDATSST